MMLKETEENENKKVKINSTLGNILPICKINRSHSFLFFLVIFCHSIGITGYI